MKILLVQPPHDYEGGSRNPSFFPLGLGYIVNPLLKSGYNVEILDIWAHQYSKEEVVERIQKLDYDVVGISAISTQYAYTKWLTSQFKKYNQKGRIVIGNALATLSPEIVLNHTQTDVCVIGEGEITFKEVVENIDRLENVDGIYFKKEGKIIKNRPRKYIENLDTIEFPAWDFFPTDIYLKNCLIPGHSDIKTMNIIVGRGCPYSCRFCSKTFKGVRLRSVDNIIQEIKELIKRYKIGGIFFNDELVVINKERIYDLCRKIKPLNLKWICQGRVNLVDYDLLKNMAESGCVAVGYGVESGSQTILNNMNKQITLEQSEQAIKDTIKAGMRPVAQMMYGYPGETKKTLQETINFFKRVPYLGYISLSITTPLPGTELYDYSLEKGLIEDEEKYLSHLSGGYMSDGRHAFINFTNFAQRDFYRLKLETETKIFLNEIRKLPLRSILSYLWKNKTAKLKIIIKKISVFFVSN